MAVNQVLFPQNAGIVVEPSLDPIGSGLPRQVSPSYFVLAGLAILYVPMFIDFASRFWLNEEDSHAGILLVGIMWAYFDRRASLIGRTSSKEFAIGGVVVAFGLAVYSLGRIAEIFQLQGLSLPIVVLGLTLASAGSGEARRCALINGLLIFTTPLLGPLGDSFLVPIRLHLTAAAADMAREFGYLVATNGVIITVGYVDLNIAGACVGLRSMVSLFAIGLLFLYYFPLKGWLANLLFVTLLPLIALAANFIRIIMLVVIAGSYGSVAELQIHDAAAYIEVIVAIGLFILSANIFQRWSVAK